MQDFLVLQAPLLLFSGMTVLEFVSNAMRNLSSEAVAVIH